MQAEFDRLKQHGLALAAPGSADEDVYLGYARLNRIEPDPASGEDAAFSVVLARERPAFQGGHRVRRARCNKIRPSRAALRASSSSTRLSNCVSWTARANELELEEPLARQPPALFGEHERGP